MRTLPVLLLAAALPAAAAVDQPIDLNRPGALDSLRQSHPGDYAAVMQQVRHVSTQACKVEVPLYHAGADLNLDRLPCRALVVKTSYPAQTDLRIPMGERVYQITVYLQSNYAVQPAVNTR
jgi:hypothetical protein